MNELNRSASLNRGAARLRQSIAAAITNPVVRSISRRATAGSVRVLGYHEVDDPDLFHQMVGRIVAQYEPITADDVEAALVHQRKLPKRAVWFTFDDGLKSTFDAAALLADHGVSGTLFVNPAAIAEPQLLWFQVREEAMRRGLIGIAEQERFSLRHLKGIPDQDRRDRVIELQSRLDDEGDAPRSLSGTVADMQAWVEAGHEIGNHTWDHPCLDCCSGAEQRDQIEKAHQWLVDLGVRPRFFAYPNGDWTEEAASVATELGYAGSLLFDHRITDLKQPHRISRLRINASADWPRVDRIVSGAHSLMFAPLLRTKSVLTG